jgi:hypothetical protein
MKSPISFTGKFAKFFTVAALAGAFLLTNTTANAERRFYGRGFYVRPAPVVVVPPYYAPGPYFAPGPVVIGGGFGWGHRGYYGHGGFYGRGGWHGRR